MTHENSATTVLVQRALDQLGRGETAARQELFNHARRRLVELTQWMMRDYSRIRRWEDTDDVLQSALVRMCRSLEAVPLQTPADFFRVAALQIRRELGDLARHYYGPNGLGRRYSKGGADSNDANSLAADNVEEIPVRLLQWTEFHRAVENLPEREREAFELIWYHELSHIEAASVMNVSDRQLRRYWATARLRLQKLLPAFFDVE